MVIVVSLVVFATAGHFVVTVVAKQYRKQHRSEPRRTANALFSFVRFTT